MKPGAGREAAGGRLPPVLLRHHVRDEHGALCVATTRDATPGRRVEIHALDADPLRPITRCSDAASMTCSPITAAARATMVGHSAPARGRRGNRIR
jgi:mRNA-degrading endonuclease toxin of MazEF toxin-antitoxin module